jgi:hypothetical protein
MEFIHSDEWFPEHVNFQYTHVNKWIKLYFLINIVLKSSISLDWYCKYRRRMTGYIWCFFTPIHVEWGVDISILCLVGRKYSRGGLRMLTRVHVHMLIRYVSLLLCLKRACLCLMASRQKISNDQGDQSKCLKKTSISTTSVRAAPVWVPAYGSIQNYLRRSGTSWINTRVWYMQTRYSIRIYVTATAPTGQRK